MFNRLISKSEQADTPAAIRLEKSFAEATLAEHRANQFALQYRCEGLIREFLDSQDDQFVLFSKAYEEYELPQIHQALRKCFPNCRLIREAGPPGNRFLCLPVRRPFTVRPGRVKNVLAEGSQCFEASDGRRRVVTLYGTVKRSDEQLIHLALIGARDESRAIANEWTQLRQRVERGPHYLSGQAIKARGAVMEVDRRLTWDDVVLDEGVRRLLKRHTIEFLAKRALFQKNGIPQRRGIVLHGPPGTGKTMIGKVLAAQTGSTFVLVGAGDIEDSEDVRGIFVLGRRLRPAILFFEDFDLYFGHRRQSRDPAVLAEFMAQMDGMESNDGLLVVGTTNDLETMEPALINRPSRFDVVVEIGLPGCADRARMFRRMLNLTAVEQKLIDQAANDTDGASGAQVQEVAVLAVQRAIEDGRVDEAGCAFISAEDLRTGIERVLSKRKRIIGFRTGKVNGAEKAT